MESNHAPPQPLTLIVEGQDVMRAMLREFVQNAFPGCAILDAGTGARAVELSVEHKPQLVLMDVSLPDANGIELITRIRERVHEIKIIVVSNLAGDAYFEHARAAGAIGYITKDRLLTELIPAIADALGIAPAAGR